MNTLNFLWYKFIFDLKSKTSQTYGGLLWQIFTPLFYTVVLFFLFSSTFVGPKNSFFPFVIIGMFVFRWFTISISESLTAIENNNWLIQLTNCSKFSILLSRVLYVFFEMMIFFIIIILILFFKYQVYFNNFLSLFFFIINLFIMISASSIIMGSAVVFLKDILYFWESVSLSLMFISGIFVDLNTFSEFNQTVLFLNPLAIYIDIFRSLLIYDYSIKLGSIVFLVSTNIILVLMSIYSLKFLDKNYIKLSQ